MIGDEQLTAVTGDTPAAAGWKEVPCQQAMQHQPFTASCPLTGGTKHTSIY